MADAIRKIVVVGGGTAGWLSAVCLVTALNEDGPGVELDLIESSVIGTIGVGESTLPSQPRTLAALGIDEADWMTRCNSTFKICVKFVDWRAHRRHVFWNPVEQLRNFDGR